MSPPKPKLVLRIGVSGHRPKNFSEAAQQIVRQSLDGIFADIAECAADIHRRETEVFDPAPPEIRVVSALAEGADRVIAEAGLAAGFALDSVIPFPAQIYETDFETPQSREAFHSLLARSRIRLVLPGCKSQTDPDVADRAYETVGLMTLRQCDILIAVWDGKTASGRGGTEDIVERAVANAIPVLRFAADGTGPFLLVNRTIVASDARDLAVKAAKDGPVDGLALRATIERLAAPPAQSRAAEPGDTKLQTGARKRLRDYLRETERHWIFAFSYPLLLLLLSWKLGFWRSFRLPPYEADTNKDWTKYWASLGGVNPSIPLTVRVLVMNRFAWADKLANYYGQKYRSAYIANFVLAAIAVLLVLLPGPLGIWAPLTLDWAQDIIGWVSKVLPVSVPVAEPDQALKVVLLFAELAVIVAIMLWTLHGRIARWHQRWVDYRQLAEQLRHLRALILTGSSTPETRTPHTGEEVQAGPLWANWYYRAVVREVGMPDVSIDESYLASARLAIGTGEIAGQCRYHHSNAWRMKRVGGALDVIGILMFFATAFICAVYLFQYSTGPDCLLDARLETLLCAGLPAIGAALFGIRVQGDFHGASDRSADMARRLAQIQLRLGDPAPISFAELSGLTEDAAAAMMSEVGDWGFVYRGRPLALPA